MNNYYLIILFLLVLVLLIGEVLRVYSLMEIGKQLAEKSAPFQGLNERSDFRILVIGDSTAVGVGVTDPKDSTAGRLAKDFPDAHLINLGKNGALTHDLIQELQNLKGQKFNLILIHIGGNDVLRLTSVKKLTVDIEEVLRLAQGIGERVVLVTAGNIGLAPFFSRPVGWFYSYRTRLVRKLFMTAAQKFGAFYVDLYTNRRDDIFLTDIKRYYSPDFLHLSGEGYRVWYEAIYDKIKQ